MNTFQYFAEDFQNWKNDPAADTVRCMVDHVEHMASILKDIEREVKA